MRREVGEADRIAGSEHVLGEADPDGELPLEHQEEVAARVAQHMVTAVAPRRIADLHEPQPGLLTGQQVLPRDAVLEVDALSIRRAHDLRACRTALGRGGFAEEGGDRDAEGSGEQVERVDRWRDLPVLDLAQQARAGADESRELAERELASPAEISQPAADLG